MNTIVHARSVWLGLKQRFRPLFALFLAILLLWTLCAPVAGTGAALREQWEQSAPAVTLEGDCGTVHVRVDAPAGAFPAGTEMRLTPAEGDEVNQAVERTVTRSVQAVEAVDIAFYDTTGAERQPERTVDVTLTDSAAPGGTAAVVHLARDGGAALVDRITQTEQGVSFRADSFSIYAVVYTVDFYYGEYEYHMPGGETMLLSQIFALLNTGLSAQRVTQAEFSDPTLVTLEQVEGDWLVHSLQPFDTEETLILTFDDGEQAEFRVTDAKNYSVYYNVNDAEGGRVYYNRDNYGESMQCAVTNDGVSQWSVCPRSSEDPTNRHLSCTRGWRFVGWLRDGSEVFGRGDGNDYSIRPNNLDRAHSFTACFAPEGEHIITFSKNVVGTNGAGGRVEQGGAKGFSYIGQSGYLDQTMYFCYSNSLQGARAVPNDSSAFDGWYDQNNNLICSTETFVPNDITEDKVVTAHFRQAQWYQVTYQSYDSEYPNNRAGNIQINFWPWSNGSSVDVGLREGWTPGSATAQNYNNYTFLCWRDSENHVLTIDPTLTPTEPLHGPRTYKAEYLRTQTKRVLLCCDSWEHGSITYGGQDWMDNSLPLDNNNTQAAHTDGSGLSLHQTAVAAPKAGYRFDHWELNGQRVSDQASVKDISRGYNSGSNVQTLTACFVPVCQVTYDLGVIRQVGNNAPEAQSWVDVPWCRKDKHLKDRSNVTELGDDKWAELVDYNGTLTLPDLTSQLQVTQAAKDGIVDYNLLTHTFRGWYLEGDQNKRLYKPGDTIQNITGPIKLTAVWDAYFPGKAGYHYTSDPTVTRFNTNTCGFFVRLFDNVFDKGNTDMYTECLFTTRLILGGSGQLAQNDKNGARLDYYGFSDAFEPAHIAAIDAGLRANANSGLTYWYDYDENPAWDAEKRTKMHDSKKKQDEEYAPLCSNTTIRLELPFPSDEFIFGRIRLWNLSAPEERKIQIGGHKIPQNMLTTDYFDLKWYVLKDQENSWHIDGMLVPKYAKLVVKKSFVGVPDAVDQAQNGYSIQVTRLDADGYGQETQSLNLNQWSENNPLGWRYIDQSNGQYVWVLDNLLPLQTYEVKEQNYTASGYTDTKTYRITNSPQTQNLSGASDTATVDKVYSYADSTSVDEIQTVSFTNLYTVPYVMTIMKQDGTTLHGLNGVTFDFMLLRNGEKIFSQACTSDANGQVAIQFNNNYYGAYDFTLKERAYEGYHALATITGQVNIDANGKVTLSNVVTTVEGVNTTINPDSVDPSIIYLQNHPERQKVKVTKRWTDDTTTPVTVVLLCDGIPVPGGSVQLNQSNNWTQEWTDLPAYVDGHRVVYTVREEWIGPAGWPTSIHYNTANGADGYEEYIVSQSQTETVDEQGNRFSNVYIENTPDHGQVKFSKVNLRKQAVSGAQFTVYTDSRCTRVATKWTAAQPNAQAVYTSNENGVVEIVGLAQGTYYVKETHAPSGYQVNNTVYKLTVKEHNSTITTLDDKPLTEVVNEDYKASIKVVKTKMGTNNTVPLAGAEFSLHSSILQNGQPVMVAKPMLGYERMVSDANGVVVVKELQQGTYFLRELKAPEGYNALTEPIKLVVDSNTEHHVQTFSGGGNQTFAQDGQEGNFVVYVQNNPGVSLPSTGGLGRERYMGAGTALVLTAGAALLLGRRRRKRTSSGHRAK